MKKYRWTCIYTLHIDLSSVTIHALILSLVFRLVKRDLNIRRTADTVTGVTLIDTDRKKNRYSWYLVTMVMFVFFMLKSLYLRVHATGYPVIDLQSNLCHFPLLCKRRIDDCISLKRECWTMMMMDDEELKWSKHK